MSSPLRYELLASDPSGARAGILHTRRGPVETPSFMPVATHAGFRHHAFEDVEPIGAGIVLSNTYHLLLSPGPEVFEKAGGIHRFMGWQGAVLTDSGGYQIFSLPSDRELTEKGANFINPRDNHRHLLSPESSIAMQQAIGSDIMMVLDVCIDSTSSKDATALAMEQTHRWAQRSLAAHQLHDTGQALFGIIQGGVFADLRKASADFLTALPFDGFSIGGLAVGESRDELYTMTGHTTKLMPADKPRYLMGVGTPIDLVESVRQGVDLFDCVLPTKMAQQGYAYTFDGRIKLTKIEHRFSQEPLEAGCDCPTCRRYSRSYVHHQIAGGHALGSRMLGIHNLRHYQRLMQRMRLALREGRFEAEYRELRERLTPVSKLPKVVGGQRSGDFEVVRLQSGQRAIRHRGHGEVMHPVGPWDEARRLYAEQTEVARRATIAGPPLRILDVGLGAAANAVAALEAALHKVRHVELVSLEVDLTPLRLALDDEQGFPFLAPWHGALEALMREGEWSAPGVSWKLLQGDAATLISKAGEGFELVFQDPFSPEKNPSLWSVDWLREVRRRCRPDGALLATYSSATPTRVAMLLAGWFVGAGVSTGTRGETTLASTSLGALPHPLSDRWLLRWGRSSARAPLGMTFTPDMEAAIRCHPQFAASVPPVATVSASPSPGA